MSDLCSCVNPRYNTSDGMFCANCGGQIFASLARRLVSPTPTMVSMAELSEAQSRIAELEKLLDRLIKDHKEDGHTYECALCERIEELRGND